MNNWNDVFSANLGKMMVIQIACAELVVKNNFRIKNISLNS